MNPMVNEIRTNWAINDAARDKGLTTPENIMRHDNISYGPFGDENLLDVYYETSAHSPQPTIVNIHGGAWVYGRKEVYQYYCMSLAMRGFTVVNINYRLSPENRFPAPLMDVNGVLKWIELNGERYNIDKDRIILIGDSAGAQIVSQYAAIYSNPEYNKLYDLKIPNVTIKALGLNCGVYDAKGEAMTTMDNIFYEYIGYYEDGVPEDMLKKLDTIGHITSAFPPSFLISAPNDFLLPQAEPMYKLLLSHGVDAKLKIYGTKEQTEVGHVFCVNIRLRESTECNDDQAEFFKKYVDKIPTI